MDPISWAQQLINLEIPITVLPLKSSNIEVSEYLDGRLSFKCCLLFTGCWLCVDAELAIGQCRLEVHGTCGLNNPCTGLAEAVITGLEFLVDLAIRDPSWVSRMKENKIYLEPHLPCK